ncbi:hypothetical protein MJO29_005796, partial [Puccinia striiformis f. sp. tritici]
ISPIHKNRFSTPAGKSSSAVLHKKATSIMHSIISVALKACVFICVIGLYSGVLGLKCPPPGKPELKFAACTRGVGQPGLFSSGLILISPFRTERTASKPGAPNRNDKFDCGDQFVKFPLCCSKVFSAKPDTRKDCVVIPGGKRFKGGGGGGNKKN